MEASDSYGSFSSAGISCQRSPTLLAMVVNDRFSGFNSSRISEAISKNSRRSNDDEAHYLRRSRRQMVVFRAHSHRPGKCRKKNQSDPGPTKPLRNVSTAKWKGLYLGMAPVFSFSPCASSALAVCPALVSSITLTVIVMG